MVKVFHIALAYLTVTGFIIRAFWSLADSSMRNERWVRIAPHVVDTLLLTLGVVLVVNLSLSPFSGWLGAKLLGVLGYIGFGVLTMRAPSRPLKLAGMAGALICVAYVFAVAFTRSPWPFAAA